MMELFKLTLANPCHKPTQQVARPRGALSNDSHK